MSKGSGSLAVGGGGGGGGSVQAAAADAIEAVGGVSGAQAAAEGMRGPSLAYWQGVFEGKTAAEANQIASTMKPVQVGVHDDGRVELIDGRHRAQAAREAGATKIAADIIVYGPRGGIVARFPGKVKL